MQEVDRDAVLHGVEQPAHPRARVVFDPADHPRREPPAHERADPRVARVVHHVQDAACDGKILDHFTTDLRALAGIRPIYESYEGWPADALDGISRRADLPPVVERYLSAIEKEVGAPLGLISLGAGRNESIVEEDFLAARSIA